MEGADVFNSKYCEFIIIIRDLPIFVDLARRMKQFENKRQRIPKGQSKMDNPENLASQGTQEEEEKNKAKTQHNMLDITIHKQIQITYYYSSVQIFVGFARQTKPQKLEFY